MNDEPLPSAPPPVPLKVRHRALRLRIWIRPPGRVAAFGGGRFLWSVTKIGCHWNFLNDRGFDFVLNPWSSVSGLPLSQIWPLGQ
jgi:hypothetical protein